MEDKANTTPATMSPIATPSPDGLRFCCYSDDDERVAQTLDEYARARCCVIGDEFEVEAVFARTERHKIVGGGPSVAEPHALFEFEAQEVLEGPQAFEYELLRLAAAAADEQQLISTLSHWANTRFGQGNAFSKHLRGAIRNLRKFERSQAKGESGA